mgnify:CR=1 FL=1
MAKQSRGSNEEKKRLEAARTKSVPLKKWVPPVIKKVT